MSRDPRFLEPTRRYFKAVGEPSAGLQVTKGGPIILVQVENEYGGHGSDKAYLGVLRDYLREAGFEVPCFAHEMGWSVSKVLREDFFCSVGFQRRGGQAVCGPAVGSAQGAVAVHGVLLGVV